MRSEKILTIGRLESEYPLLQNAQMWYKTPARSHLRVMGVINTI